jgi:hypothetical protein
MSEQGAFEASRRAKDEPKESPFGSQFQPERVESSRNELQKLSPDKRVVEVDKLSALSPTELGQFRDAFRQVSEQCQKIDEPLRNVWNNQKLQELNGGDENSSAAKWAKNYMDKISGVLGANLQEISASMDFRVAIPVQSFLPGPNGNMSAETLYAFFPPTSLGVNERYVMMPLFSGDPGRQAQLEKNPSFANSVSWHELAFRCKANQLVERRDHS